MTRRGRLMMLLELARDRAAEEARALGRERQVFGECRQRLEALRAFRDDYDEQARGDSGRSFGAVQLKSRRHLVDQLDGALAEAERTEEEARRRVAAAELRWRERRTRSGALEKAVERLAAEETRQRHRTEQRRLDEHVGFALATRKSTT